MMAMLRILSMWAGFVGQPLRLPRKAGEAPALQFGARNMAARGARVNRERNQARLILEIRWGPIKIVRLDGDEEKTQRLSRVWNYRRGAHHRDRGGHLFVSGAADAARVAGRHDEQA